MERLNNTTGHVALLAVLSAAFRIGPWLATRHITFDEGVFLASNDLARSGFTPFQDFFSSQGPLFLPLLKLGQMISFDDPRGPRIVVVIAGVAISVALYFILRRVTTSGRALIFSSVAATSGTVLLAAGPVQSDGIALALAMGALALVLKPNPSIGRTFGVGLLAGAAVAVKSLHAVPILIVVTAVLVWRMDWKRFGTVAATGLGFVVFASLPYGLDLVWEQYVLFHLAKDNSPDLLDNLANSRQLLLKYDLPTLVLSVFAIGFAFRSAAQRPSADDSQVPRWIPVLWLLTTVVVLMGFTTIDGGFGRTLAFLIPPLLAVAALSKAIPIRGLLVIAVVGGILQFANVDITPGPGDTEIETIEHIWNIPETSYFVGDEPGLGWSARRLSHPSTVDPSFARLSTGYLTPRDVEAALADPRTCIYLATSGRFESAEITVPGDYLITTTPGVFRRADC